MFCRNCGAPIDPASQRCSHCGAFSQSITTNPTPPKRRVAWVLWSIGVCIFLIFLVRNFTSESSTSSVEESTTTRTQPSTLIHRVNETVTVGVWSYEVIGTHWATSIGSDYT